MPWCCTSFSKPKDNKAATHDEEGKGGEYGSLLSCPKYEILNRSKSPGTHTNLRARKKGKVNSIANATEMKCSPPGCQCS